MSALNAHLERVMRETGFMHEGNAEQLGARVRRSWRARSRTTAR
jgi:hypothetical protein